jgi:hypothetical protein
MPPLAWARLNGAYMNTGNALGFLLFAVVTGFLPALAPGWFPPTGTDGTSGRALWLEIMALVQGGWGTSYLFSRWIVPAAGRAAVYLPRRKVPAGSMLPASSQVRAA